MFTYTLCQWLVFFYFYCFIGWIWECCFIFVTTKKLTNRGFLIGPILPIYGSGACIILMATLPVQYNLILIFLFGMISATILEYISGAIMESIFKVRYWDYTNDKFNLNGYICLECSLAWGAFSILMVKVIHKPISHYILMLPDNILHIIVCVVTIIFVVDLTISVRDALDFKELLSRITETSEDFKRLQKRLDVLIAILDNEKSGIISKLGEYKNGSIDKILSEFEAIKEKLVYEKERFSIKKLTNSRLVRLLRRNPGATSKYYVEAMEKVKDEKEIDS